MRRTDFLNWETKRRKGKAYFVITLTYGYTWNISGLTIKNYLYTSWQWFDYILSTIIYIVATVLIAPNRWYRHEAKYFQQNK